jgi:3-dehydroquinate synthetase
MTAANYTFVAGPNGHLTITDKKTVDGAIPFVLPVEIGRVEIGGDVPERAVLQAVDKLRTLSQA